MTVRSVHVQTDPVRQDLGKFSYQSSVIFFIARKGFRKHYTVFIFNKVNNQLPHFRHDSMAKMYMNRFAIEEDGQFEIHVKHCSYGRSYNRRYGIIDENELYNAAKEVMLKAQQGSGFSIQLNNKIYN